MSKNPLEIPDEENEILREADVYLRDHKILELFEDMTTMLSYKQPDNLEAFLVEQLKTRKKEGNRATAYHSTEL